MNSQRGSMLIDFVIWGIVIAVVLGAAAVAWHHFTESYREQGRAEVREEVAPLMEQCKTLKQSPANCAEAWRQDARNAAISAANYARCDAAVKEQSNGVAALARASEAATANSARVLADLARRVSADSETRELRLRQLATPAATKEKACDDAASILAVTNVRRVLNFSPDVAPGSTGSADGNGTSSGSGSVRRVR